MGGAPHEQVILGYTRKRTEQALGTKSVSSVPS